LDDVADRAFDDQCTVSNPRYPMISELKALLLRAYHGDSPLLSAPEAPEPVTTP
jgi:acetaldehyde dehydrogenase/alcohol dehydrogenase